MHLIATLIGVIISWLLNTLILWIALRITARLGMGGYDIGFWEGFVKLLPITAGMAILGIVLFLIIGVFAGIVMLIAWIMVLRYILDLEWFEILILCLILTVLQCVVGGIVPI